jgi:hypothetical protein
MFLTHRSGSNIFGSARFASFYKQDWDRFQRDFHRLFTAENATLPAKNV